MIKKFIDKLLGKTGSRAGKPRFGKREEIAVDVHGIDPKLVDERALNVVRTLKEAGHEAYVVGGAVRDLLLGLKPKDFDVATNATPEQVKQLFRNCRLIGRRFHLAHVRFGHEIIEVATFRAAHTEIDEDHGVDEVEHRAIDEHGRILRDNLYGTIEEDVWRRDFTANALYYNIEDYSIWDYVGGVEDARNRILRLIGDPATRYREDPVRMLRAARLAAKLGFTIEAATAEPLPRLAPLLAEAAPARLFEETLKLFLSGHAVASFELLEATGLLPALLPLYAQLSPDAYGGAVLLGVDGVCIISHGSSGETAMVNAIKLADEMARSGLVAEITAAFAATP